MRLTKLWTIPVIVLLTACSTETLTDSTTIPTGDDAVSFARLNVNLPSVPTTRAYTPDYTPDAGADNEFKVTGKTRVFLFENEKGADATSEDEYTFLYEAEPTDWLSDKNASGDEYQDYESFIIKLRGANKSYSNLYALVVLNGDNIPAPSSLGQTFGSYNDAISLATEGNTARYLGDTNKGFVMANAANAAKAGTDADPTVLVPLTLYSSPDAAKNGPGNSIYVERSAVKVTVTKAQKAYPLKSDANVTVTPLAWTLTNTNLKMYPFHKVTGLRTEGAKSYKDIWTSPRFLGKPFDGFRRTQWSMDPNYETDLKTAEFHVAAEADVTAEFSTTATGGTVTYHPLYCAENTFDIAHMMKGQTTAVVIMAQITGYSRAVSTRADATDADATDDDRYYVEGKVYKTDGMLSKVAAVASDAFGVTVKSENIVLKSLLGKADITLTTENFKDLKTEAGAVFTPTTDQLKQLNTLIGPITRYKGGICYYIGYIRHFGDDETRWKSGEDRYGTGDDANKKYLGRYGVVRNNWYDLTIQDFAYPGSPDIPKPKPEDPDDDNSTIVLSVKVNPWAKEDTKFVPLE